jgi:hypothetical protein
LTDGSRALWTALAGCCLCAGLIVGLLALALRLVRGHGAILLPLMQLFSGRQDAEEDALTQTPAPFATAKPDLHAIARAQDFDEAVAAQQARRAQPPLSTPGWAAPGPPSPPGLPRPPLETPRTRDEDEEFGFDTLDE